MKKTDVLAYFGTQAKTALACGISQVAVCKWPENIHPLWSYRLEALTDRALKAEDPWLLERTPLKQTA